MSIYSSIPQPHLKRSLFHWRAEHNTTMDLGPMLPFFWREVLPGDLWKINLSLFARLQPLVSAPFTPLRFYCEFWFFPTRVLMQKMFPEIVDAWETFIFGGPNGDGKNEAEQTPTLPLWIPNRKNVRLEGTVVQNGVQSHKFGHADAVGSLWDHFGYPVNAGYNDLDDEGKRTIPGTLDKNDYSDFVPLAFPKIAYNLWWNEFKRNENLEEPVDLMSEDVQFCKWKKDYFTSANPFQQRGEPVALPLTGLGQVDYSKLFNDLGTSNIETYASVRAANNIAPGNVNLYNIGEIVNWNAAKVTSNASPTNDYRLQAQKTLTVTNTSPIKDAALGVSMRDIANKLTGRSEVDFSNVATADVADFRLMFQTQKFMERAARGGVRYVEGLKAFFGTSPRNDILQLPQFIGGMKQNIIVNEVLQTSTSTDSNTPQGNVAGRGITSGGDNIGVLSAREHGYIMGVCWIKPDLYYNSQGIHREALRRSRYDFYFPQFAHLSERPVMKAEIYAKPSAMSPNQLGKGAEGVFGYQGIYNEYRSSVNHITGQMRDTFDYWTFSRKFDQAPELNSDFLTCFPRKDVFAVQDEDVALVDILTDVKVARPMPLEPIPGLLDHF